ncbi:Protein ACCELERATED CELL DEATH 6 [Senna tora]|uniref:Protein ACCELERATED CELL DEATH 6 n=1 Tax=Senna tora TaxID=362788 RepID=A0A834X2A3_9FABA|nr:Protein ACCELERATED CELL DEATH 6 [Senna tora]
MNVDDVHMLMESDESWRQICFDRMKRLQSKEIRSSEDPASQAQPIVPLLMRLPILEKQTLAELIAHHFPQLLSKKNIKGDTPLHVAARAKSSGVIRAILSHKDHIAQEQDEKLTELGNAYGNTRLCMRLLVANMLKGWIYCFKQINVWLIMGTTLSQTSMESLLYMLPYTNGRELRDEYRGTPLHYAAYIGYVEGVQGRKRDGLRASQCLRPKGKRMMRIL